MADVQDPNDVQRSAVDNGRSAGEKDRCAGDRAAAAAALKRLRNGGDTRSRKTRRIRGAIRAGIYENQLKLSVAIDRLLEGLCGRE